VVNRCWLCESDGESVDHLLIHCGVTNALWNAILSRLGLSWVMLSSVKELMACWCLGGRTRSAVVWKMIPLCLMWCIWRERNTRCFEDSTMSFEEIVHYVLFTLYTWTSSWLDPLVVSFSDFLSRLSSPSASPCIRLVYYGLCPFCAFIIYFELSKKKKKNFGKI
jgi:hypothetical protein